MRVSVNPMTQEKCEIPAILDDKKNIQDFVNRNQNKKIIVVQGLGFVGAVMSLVCANAISEEYAVIGVDLPNENTFWKIKSINDGIFPLTADDPKIKEFYENSRQKNNFYATYDSIAYSYADVVIVDINLDVDKKSYKNRQLKEFDVNLKGFENAIGVIGDNCKHDVVILVETTVPPGTCEQVIKPTIDQKLTKRGLSIDSYKLGHSYERVMPGPNYINSIREFPRVYSGINEESANAIEDFLKTIIDISKCDLVRLEHTNATEIAKVLENSYRAANIAFAVEWSRFAEEAGVNLYSIVDAIRVRETHSNLMYPGIGVGGYCLTKDPLLASWSRKSFFKSDSNLEISINGVSINDQMPIFAFNRLIEVFGSLSGKKIIFMGVSYRGDVGDTRFSPVQPLFNLIKNEEATTFVHDPFVSYWEEENLIVESDLQKLLDLNPDIIIISSGHSQYKKNDTIQSIKKLNPLFIFDTIGLLNEKQIFTLKKFHRISVLGRGDLI